MEKLYPNKWLSIIIGLLIVTNIASLGTFWFLKSKEKGLGGKPPMRREAAVFIIKELGLTKEQQATYKTLIDEHQRQMRSIRREMMPLKDRFFRSIADTSFRPEELEGLAGRIGTKEKELQLATYRHFRELRRLCTPQQQVKFDQIITRVMHMVAPRPPGPGKRPGPPPFDGEGDHRPPPPPGYGPPDGPPPPGPDGEGGLPMPPPEEAG